MVHPPPKPKKIDIVKIKPNYNHKNTILVAFSKSIWLFTS